MLSLQARVDLGAMAMKGESVFPKAPALLEPHHQIISCHMEGEGLLPFYRDAVSVFYVIHPWVIWLVGCFFFSFKMLSTFVGYLMPKPYL